MFSGFNVECFKINRVLRDIMVIKPDLLTNVKFL
jgi:hypothetical protein